MLKKIFSPTQKKIAFQPNGKHNLPFKNKKYTFVYHDAK